MDIPKEDLKPAHLPGPDDGQLTWIDFALTFDGYDEKGSQDACSAFANAVRKQWD